MSKKFDIRTRQGRARRRAKSSQFNPYTLYPNTESFVAMRRNMKQNRKAK